MRLTHSSRTAVALAVLCLSVHPARPGNAAPAHSDASPWKLLWISRATNGLPEAVEARPGTREARRILKVLAGQDSPPQAPPMLRLVVEPAHAPLVIDLPSVAGKCEVLQDRIRFTPRFPLEEGVTYRAEFRPPPLSTPLPSPSKGPITERFYRAAPSLAPSTVVQQVYPSPDWLPENLLKFYLHFSESMSRGFSYDHITLLNEAGQPVELPFLEIDQELWNRDLTRLTLLIDPGRIKRGVKPLEDAGPALEAGRSFTLAIAPTWKDARGVPLKTGFKKTFTVTVPDRVSPDPGQWRLQTPMAGTRSPLEIRFEETLDHALAQRLIRVQSRAASFLTGEVTLHDQERTWRFVPDQSWARGAHAVVVNSILEDLAGNSVGRLFEVDVFEKVEARALRQTVSLPFTVK